MTEPICSVGEVSYAAQEQYNDTRAVIAAEAMANAANNFSREAVCGGNWKNRRKTVEKQLKNAAKQELRVQLGIGFIGMILIQWLIKSVFEWFVNRYFEGE